MPESIKKIKLFPHTDTGNGSSENEELKKSLAELHKQLDIKEAQLQKVLHEQNRTEAILQGRDRVLEAISFASEKLLTTSDWRNHLSEVMEYYGKTVEASRVYISENEFLDDNEIISNRIAEWAAPKVIPMIEHPVFQSLSMRAIGFERWEEMLSSNQIIKGDICDFPEQEKGILEVQDIKSILVVPIFLDDFWWGFIGFDSCFETHAWTDIENEILIIAADILGTVINNQKTNEALRKSEERYSMTIAAVNDGIWDWNIAADEIYMSPKCYEMLGYAPNSLPSYVRSWQDVIHPDDSKKVLGALKKHLNGDSQNYYQEYRCKTLDGEWKWIYDRGRIVEKDSDGSSIRMLGTHTDITKRKEIENQLKKSHALQKAIFDYASVGIALLDPAGEIIEVNRRWLEMLGYEREEVINLNCLSVTYPEDQGICNIITEIFNSDENNYFRIEKRYVRKDGSVFWTDYSAAPIRDENGKVNIIICIIEDISELINIRKEAEDANKAKSEFLANMSHEIRTPMNAVVGMIELLLDTEVTQEQRDYIETISISTDTLLELINDILDLSKIEAGQLPLKPEPMDLDKVVYSAVQLLHSKAEDKNIGLTVNYGKDVPIHVIGDALRIRQILINLVNNAVKFTSQGEVKVEVENLLTENGLSRIQIKVSDTGIGIDKEDCQYIFDRFKQIDSPESRKLKGTGLGLAITKQLIQLMNGEIEVESQKGKGSVFTLRITLPSSRDNYSATQINKELKGARIMVADCHAMPDVCQRLDEWSLPYLRLQHARDVLEALRHAQQTNEAFHLLILSYRLADMNGGMLARIIKEDNSLKNVNIISITSVAYNAEMRYLQRKGLLYYLASPVSPSELFDSLIDICLPQLKDLATDEIQEDTLSEENTELNFEAKILVVEDNISNQKVILKALEKMNFKNVTVADDGQQALALFKINQYDLIMMDCQMPIMDGFQATKKIRLIENNNANESHVPIIAVTANAMRGDREKCIFAGMDDYISKPVRKKNLMVMLTQYCSSPAKKQTE
jgi:PAS domain S-box-containing protein